MTGLAVSQYVGFIDVSKLVIQTLSVDSGSVSVPCFSRTEVYHKANYGAGRTQITVVIRSLFLFSGLVLQANLFILVQRAIIEILQAPSWTTSVFPWDQL